jgi:hypothetical protein
MTPHCEHLGLLYVFSHNDVLSFTMLSVVQMGAILLVAILLNVVEPIDGQLFFSLNFNFMILNYFHNATIS